jgi:hypothetical protein
VWSVGRLVPLPHGTTIRRMRIAYWIPKATKTLRIRNTSCFYTATVIARRLFNVKVHVHCLSFFLFKTRRRVGMGGIAPLILNASDVWGWVIKSPLTAGCFTLGKRAPNLPSLEGWKGPGAGMVGSE